MPAIQPERLKRQAAELSQHFHKPSSFIRELSHLFEYYADRAKHQRQSGRPPTVLPAYNIAPPVFKRILVALDALIQSHPDDAVTLADSLWNHSVYDARLLAASILGRVPITDPDLIIHHLTTWAANIPDDALFDNLKNQAMKNIIIHSPQSIITLAENSLASEHKNDQLLGLVSLQALIGHKVFDNLPVIFKLLSSYLQSADNQFRPNLLKLILLLIEKSPIETAVFIEQCISDAKNRIPRWLLRYSLDHFPSDLQPRMGKILRA